MSVFNPFLCCLSPFYLVVCHCFKAKLNFYPNMASRKPSKLSSQKQHVPINNTSNQPVDCKKTISLVLDNLNFDVSIP